jgi:hypothetical protein
MADNAEVETPEEVKVETTETTAVAAEVAAPEIPSHFVSLEVTTQEEYDSKINELKEAGMTKAQAAAALAEYQEKLAIFQGVDADPDEEVAQFAALKQKGISGRIAGDIMGMTDEELEANPMKALMLAEAIKDPANFNKYKDKIEKAIRERYNLGDEGEYTPTAGMEIDAIRAISDIKKLKGEVADVKNPYKFAREQHQQTAQQIVEKQKSALNEVNTYVKELKEVTYKYGDKEIALQVSKAEIESLLASQSATALGYFFDTSTKEGKQAARDWAKDQILLHKFQSGEVGQKIVESIATAATKEAIKDVHNGQPVIPDRSGKSPKDDRVLTAVQKDLLAKGITPPSMKPTS